MYFPHMWTVSPLLGPRRASSLLLELRPEGGDAGCGLLKRAAWLELGALARCHPWHTGRITIPWPESQCTRHAHDPNNLTRSAEFWGLCEGVALAALMLHPPKLQNWTPRRRCPNRKAATAHISAGGPDQRTDQKADSQNAERYRQGLLEATRRATPENRRARRKSERPGESKSIAVPSPARRPALQRRGAAGTSCAPDVLGHQTSARGGTADSAWILTQPIAR